MFLFSIILLVKGFPTGPKTTKTKKYFRNTCFSSVHIKYCLQYCILYFFLEYWLSYQICQWIRDIPVSHILHTLNSISKKMWVSKSCCQRGINFIGHSANIQENQFSCLGPKNGNFYQCSEIRKREYKDNIQLAFGGDGCHLENWKVARGRQMSRSLNTSEVLATEEPKSKILIRVVHVFGLGKGGRGV